VRSNQMANGSRQACEPPRFVEIYLLQMYIQCLAEGIGDDFQDMFLGGHANETYNFLRVNDPD